MPRRKTIAQMESQTCAVCGKVGDRSTFHPESGWDWYHGVRLCPAHAHGSYALIEAEMKRVAAQVAADIKARALRKEKRRTRLNAQPETPQ